MSDAAPIAPAVLGGFVLQRKIGEGGFGTVYLAEQPSLKRLAVVKVMRGALRERSDAVRRFELEAQLASKLDHPCAAHIYAFGTEADGTLWIAMEYVRGTSLDTLLTSGALPLDRVVPMMTRLCDAVATAHEQGIIHRDIKPANVIVAAKGGRLSPKLLDFGIAKQLEGVPETPSVNAVPDEVARPHAGPVDETPSLDVTLPSRAGATGVTQLGQLLGSPRYMAPEQWLDSRLIGPWTDQYALALLAYEALTGRRAFDGTTTSELAEQHMTAELPKTPLISEPVYAVLARAASKDPKARHADVGALAVALRDAAGLGPEPDEPPPALRADLRAMWMNDAPQPIAEMIAALTAARSAGRVCERVAAVARTVAHWLGILAIASRSRAGRLDANAAALAALRDLRRQVPTDEQWLDLALALARDFTARPEAFPIPELIAWCGDGDAVATLRPLLRGDLLDTDDAASTRRATTRVRELERALESLSWLLDYGLGRDVAGGVELWLGIRPVERVVDPWPADADRGVVVLDADGARAVKLSPLVLIAPPMPGELDEVFVFCGPSVGGEEGVYRAWPRGFELREARVWTWFAEHVLDAGPVADARAQDDRPPYPGLAPYTADDRASFIGREREVAEVVNRLRAHAIVAIVGPSGAGKSSFVAAGVLPALDGEHVTIRPGRRPLAALAAVASDGAPYRDALPGDADGDVAARLVASVRRRAVQLTLFVDQAEELFTQGSSEDERIAFAAALVALAASGHARVVLALRDDFLVRIDELEPWRGSVGRAIHILRTPGRGDLERIVAEPARRRGFDFDDPALPAEMAAEVDGRPGALPLLAFAAASLWERRDRHFHRITRSAYADLGGVTGALVGHADGVLQRMSPADRRTVRAVFRRLLTVEGARAGHGRDELVAALADHERAASVLERLLEARLLVSLEDDDGERVEVIHEALATTWTTLAQWRREDAAGIRRHEQLAAAARAWHDRERPPGLLWRGEALDDLRSWLATTDAALSPVEDAFAAASIAAARRARRGRLVLVAAGFAALAGVIVVLAALNRNIADKRASAEQLAAAGFEERARLALLEGNAAEALLYLAEATRRGVSGPAHDLLVHRATTSVEAFDGFAGRDPDRFLGAVLGERAIATSTGDVSTLWNRTTGQAVQVADGYACSLAGDAIATLNRSGDLTLTEATGQVRWRTPAAHAGLGFAYPSLRGHVAAQAVATVAGKQVRLWGLSDGRARGTLAHPVTVEDVAFDAAGERVATTALDGAIRIWDVATASLTASCATPVALHSVRFEPTGQAVVATGHDGAVRVCTITGELRHEMSGHLGISRSLDISPDGRLAASTSVDGTARLWDLAAGKALAALSGHRGSLRAVKFSPDGGRVATGGDDATIRIWDVDSGAQLALLQGHAARVDALRWDSDARIVSASYDGTLRLWSVAGLDTSARGHAGASDDLTQSPDGRHVITVGAKDGVAIIRDAVTAEQRLVLRGERPIATASFAGSARIIATSGDGTAQLRSVADGALHAAIATGDRSLTNAVAADDGRLLVTAAARDGRGIVRLWRTEPPHNGAIVAAGSVELDFEPLHLVFDPSGRWLAVAPVPDHRREFAIVMIDATTGREAARLPVGKNVLKVTIDRTRIAIAYDRLVRTFELATWQPVATLRGHRGIVQHVELLPDGRAVTSSDDAAVHVWDRLGNLVAPLPSRGRPTALAVSPGGEFLAVGRGPVVEVWDAQALRLLVATRLHREAIIAMQFSADGSRVTSTGFDGRVGITRIAHPPRSADDVARIVKCYVPLRLEGDTALPREVDHGDPACARQPLR